MRTLTRACGTAVVVLALAFTLSASQSVLAQDYSVTPSQVNTIAGGSTDIGNHCDDCTTNVALPFPYRLYDQTFTTANVSSNGNIQFQSNSAAFQGCLPNFGFSYVIAAQWTDLRTDGSASTLGPSGIFTSVTGSAPNRAFIIEWRARYFNTGAGVAHFVVRLYEGQQRFDIIYSTISQTNTAAVGVQKDTGSQFTQYSCDTTPEPSGLQLTFTLRRAVANGRLAFRFDSPPATEIHLRHPSDSPQVHTPVPHTQGGSFPDWSPDGSKIAYSKPDSQTGSVEIFVTNPDGSGQTRLTDAPGDDIHAAWSPDGSKIAFTSFRDSAGGDVYVMDAGGTNQTRLTSSPSNDSRPTWSPDGGRIAFVSARAGANQIFVMNADGSGQTRLSFDPQSASDDAPHWSPDGTKIVFDSYRDFNVDVYVMNADGSNRVRLTSDPGQNYEPVWSPDGRRIAFSYYETDFRTTFRGIYLMSADGSSRSLFTQQSDQPSWQPISAAQAGDVLISEFRFRGPGGEADEYVEFYNNTDSAITVATADGTGGWALYARGNDGVFYTWYVIPNGTVIPARGHLLLVELTGYSLGAYAPHDRFYSYVQNLADGGGVALYKSTNLETRNRLDAVGFSGESSSLLREGAGLSPSTGVHENVQFCFTRKLSGGRPQDTNDNAEDFILVSTNPAATAGGAARLGAPGPENTTSPVNRGSSINASLIDPSAPPNGSPNRVRNTDAYSDVLTPTTTYPLGTLSIQRRFTNNTGRPVTKLRFRVVDVTTLNTPYIVSSGTQADLRLLTSGGAVLASGAVNVTTVRGVTLEQPPGQPQGGGWNSSVSVDLSALPGGQLGAGQSVDVQFLLGVAEGGSFRFFVVVEALP